jgi:hypothetical protein
MTLAACVGSSPTASMIVSSGRIAASSRPKDSKSRRAKPLLLVHATNRAHATKQNRPRRCLVSSPARLSPRLNPHSPRHCRRTTRCRDFVPWRFSAAGRWSAWLDPRYRRPKTCTTADSCTAAKKNLYSITSSARASSVAGISRPSARAVGTLMTNSNVVDWITGRSPGLAPLSILPV